MGIKNTQALNEKFFDRLKGNMASGLKEKVKQARRNFNILYHIGSRYVCPICGYHSKDFGYGGEDSPILSEYHVIGAGKRRCVCYKCESYDRERLVFLYLKEHEGLFGGSWPGKILHLAPEKATAHFILNLKVTCYICGDHFAEGYKYPSYVRKMNALSLPFMEKTFDLLICNHVLEHIEDDHKAMSEFYRVLKNGGKVILQVPISYAIPNTIENPDAKSPEDRLKYFGQKNHVRIYGSDYKSRLEKVGFKVELFRFPDKTADRYGLNREENLYICRK